MIDRTLPRFCKLQASFVVMSKLRSPLVKVTLELMCNVSASGDQLAVVIRGEFQNSDSAYGTFDQGGNLWEWIERIGYISQSGASRRLRGGSWDYGANYLQSPYCDRAGFPSIGNDNIGFRVVQAVPEPASLLALLFGVGVLPLLRRRRL